MTSSQSTATYRDPVIPWQDVVSPVRPGKFTKKTRHLKQVNIHRERSEMANSYNLIKCIIFMHMSVCRVCVSGGGGGGGAGEGCVPCVCMCACASFFSLSCFLCVCVCVCVCVCEIYILPGFNVAT